MDGTLLNSKSQVSLTNANALREALSWGVKVIIATGNDALRALWNAAFPDIELRSLISEQWKEMGWQGKDPSTDFRGGGFISLENLYFAITFPEMKVMGNRGNLYTTKEAHSIGLFHPSCFMDVISLLEMEEGRHEWFSVLHHNRNYELGTFIGLQMMWLSRFFALLCRGLAWLALQTMNDWYDRDIVAINEPYRPIPSGVISENEVISQIWVLFLARVGIAGRCEV